MVEQVVYEKDLREMVKDILTACQGHYSGEEEMMEDIMFRAGLPSMGKVKVV